MENPSLWFRTICRKNGLVLTDTQVGLFEQYVALLLEWNRKINLISRRDEEQVWSNHILHCVSILFKLNLRAKEHILDLGTGGGLPGIPLSILLPDSHFVLLDATRKKVNAVQNIVQTLGLSDVQVVWGRAEELTKDQALVSRFGYIIARAVAPLRDLVKWSVPFARRGERPVDVASTSGRPVNPPALIALKGGDLDTEIKEAKVRAPIREVEVVDLVFHGSEEILTSDKKIVVVSL